MRYLILSTLLFLFIAPASAQSPLDEEGNQFSLASGYTTAGIPISASYEMGVTEDISFGIEASYRTFDEEVNGVNYTHNIAGLTFFGNYYFNTLLKMKDEMGLYAGLNVSYYKYFSPEGFLETGKSSSTLSAGGQLGYRYYFGDFGVYIEGIGNIDHVGSKLGLTYRLPY